MANPTFKPDEQHDAARARPSPLTDTRVIYCGDNLEQLRKLPDECIDLIYIDPPFNSNGNYEVFWGGTRETRGEKNGLANGHGSTRSHIDYMRPRCVEMARVLRKSGSLYYHRDWHASHYVKVMLDEIFGEHNFLNNIVRLYGGFGVSSARHFARKHDDILFYADEHAGRLHRA